MSDFQISKNDGQELTDDLHPNTYFRSRLRNQKSSAKTLGAILLAVTTLNESGRSALVAILEPNDLGTFAVATLAREKTFEDFAALVIAGDTGNIFLTFASNTFNGNFHAPPPNSSFNRPGAAARTAGVLNIFFFGNFIFRIPTRDHKSGFSGSIARAAFNRFQISLATTSPTFFGWVIIFTGAVTFGAGIHEATLFKILKSIFSV